MVKYTKELSWKKEILSGTGTEQDPYVYGDPFSVDLDLVEAHARANFGADYCGNSADSSLKLHFLEEPSQEIKDAIDAYWNGITPASAEATGYKTQAQIQAALAAMKAGLVAKTWDQMSVAERKLATGQSLAKNEIVFA